MLLDWLHLPQEGRAPVIIEELEAVVVDLQHLRGFLAKEVAKSLGSLEDDSRERWLTVKAEEWADALGEYAAIERKVLILCHIVEERTGRLASLDRQELTRQAIQLVGGLETVDLGAVPEEMLSQERQALEMPCHRLKALRRSIDIGRPVMRFNDSVWA